MFAKRLLKTTSRDVQLVEISLSNRRHYPPLAPPRRGMRRLPMHKFPSWEGQGVGSHISLHIALYRIGEKNEFDTYALTMRFSPDSFQRFLNPFMLDVIMKFFGQIAAFFQERLPASIKQRLPFFAFARLAAKSV